jgi:hydroxyacylglutathione hydrolase
MTIKSFIFNPFQVNTYVLHDETNEAIIIDAACQEGHEQEAINAYLKDNNLTLKMLVNTHCHVDHLMGVKYLATKYDAPFAACKDDYYLMANAPDQAMMFGLEVDLPPDMNQYLKEGDALKFGNSELQIFQIPGHSLGSIALYSKADGVVFAGDVIFKGSIGRTDLPGGDFEILIQGIKTKLFTLPAETVVFSGHGPSTTIQAEHDTNPFFNQ